ncbi:MAG TPA: patatin family protein [Firmicutes bacterium]|nr:patatin family protein [Bacillota bacterium]
MSSLVLEGGTFRPIFSSGVMDALLEYDILFPYIIGVSAGITHGVSYISKQKRRNLDIAEKYRNDKRYLGIRNLLKCRSIFGLDFVFDEIPNRLHPFDMNTYTAYHGRILIGVTNAKTGQAEYMDGKKLDDRCLMLRATCAIPMFFPAILIDGTPYFDGGICDPIPIRKAIQDGNQKHLIILTQIKGYEKTLNKQNIYAAKWLKRKYPAMVEPLLTRHILYNETIAFCEQLEKNGQALIIRPSQPIHSFEKDIIKLKAAYDDGFQQTLERIDEIREIIE